jgi:hypothetical protein
MTSRRAFLGGAAGLLALPWLESLPSARAAATTPPKRLLVIWTPNGFRPELWRPTETGPGFLLSPSMAPLERVRDRLLVLSGLDNLPGIFPVRVDEHSGCAAATLTASQAAGARLAPNAGWSVDQLVASAIGDATPFPYLALGSERALRCYVPGICDGFVTISWQGFRRPVTKDISPEAVYHRVFGGLDPSLPPAELAARQRMEQRVLDTLHSHTQRFATQLSAGDRDRLDEYLTGLSGIERRLQEHAVSSTCSGGGFTPADSADPTAQVRSMADLIGRAFQCDRTRVATWMLGTGRSERSLQFLGHAVGHHQLSHEPQWTDAHLAIERWQAEQLAYVIETLAALPEPDGSSVLDHTLVLFTGSMGDGASHSPLDLCAVLAGAVPQTDTHLRFPSGTPWANLHLSVLRAFGVEQETFGDDGTASLLDLG